MTLYDFEKQKKAWSRPPIGGANDTDPAEVLTWDDNTIVRWMAIADHFQRQQASHKGGIYEHLILNDLPAGCTVLDYGCGLGWWALQHAMRGRKLIIADIVENNVLATMRVLQAHGFNSSIIDAYFINPQNLLHTTKRFDVFHCTGVLHHTPYARQILECAHQALKPGGQARIMLYTDYLFREYMKADPAETEECCDNPHFLDFAHKCDNVGDWADWYSMPKILALIADLFNIQECEYVRPDRGNIALRLVKI